MSHTPLLSSLVRQQLPEFIRSDYEVFVKFIEAYYAYLEETNNAIDFSKHLLQYADVDRTLTEFEEYFTRTFLPLISTATTVDKATLIKHAKELYTTKGTKKSFEFLFRALYGEEVSIFYPKDYILRASDGKWIQRQSLRISPEFYTTEVATGSETVFGLLDAGISVGSLSVYLDEVLQTSGYTISLNTPRLTFTTAPAADVVVKIVYHSYPIQNRIISQDLVLSITGIESGATAVSESAATVIIKGTSAVEIFITPTNSKSFRQGELVQSRYYYIDETKYFSLTFTLLSSLGSIDIINGGSSYNVGDPVLLIGGDYTVAGSAEVESVYQAIITKIVVLNGGAGFKSGDPISIVSTPNTGLTASITTVDSSGYYHPSTITIDEDVISLYSNVVLSNTDYGFPVAGMENTSTRIVDALTFGSVQGLGPITNVAILSSTFEFPQVPVLNADSPTLSFTSTNASSGSVNSTIRIVDLGILGRMTVLNGGAGYTPGDELVFTNILTERGVGAAGEVITVHPSNNGIQTVQFQPPRISGTVSTVANTISVTGANTNFLGELIVGDRIEVGNESRYINAISSNTSLNVNVSWTKTSTNRYIGVYGKNFVGGSGYRQSALPTVSVISSNTSATGAVIRVDAIYGDGENLLPLSEFQPGQIRAIAVSSGGEGYVTAPVVDLSHSGDGTATAVAQLLASKFTYPGRFATTDSLLSSDRHLEDRDYYQNFSYVLQSRVDFSKYKQILLDLLHPVGMKFFGEYLVDEFITQVPHNVSTDSITLETRLSGTVNVGAGSVLVIGTGTTFNVAQAQGQLTIGTTIEVNSEIRVVNTVINNTNLTVTVPFTYTANDQVLTSYTVVSEEVANTLITQSEDYLVTQYDDYLIYQ